MGEPGPRIFFLQAVGDGELVTLKCEKQQVGALAEYLARILSDLPKPGDDEIVAIDVDFVDAAGSGLGRRVRWAWPGTSRTTASCSLCEELVVEDEDDEDAVPVLDPGSARFRLTRAQVAAFVEHRPRSRRRRAAAVLPVRRSDGPRRPRLPPVELMATDATSSTNASWTTSTTSRRLTRRAASCRAHRGPRSAERSGRRRPLLRTGDVEVRGRMPWSSNGTFLAEVHDDDGSRALARLQARARRAPAVGLPTRPLAPRDRGLPALRGARLGARSVHGPS